MTKEFPFRAGIQIKLLKNVSQKDLRDNNLKQLLRNVISKCNCPQHLFQLRNCQPTIAVAHA